MHELGVTFYVVKDVKKVAQENKVDKIDYVKLEIGEVSGVVHDQLIDCWNWARKKEAVTEHAKIYIETLEARRDAIKATVASAKAQEHINKIVSGGDKAKSSMESFERYEKKAEKMLDAASAEAELNTHTSAASTLADKYTSNGSDASVEDELAAMKAKLGL